MDFSFGEVLRNYRETKNMSLSELHRKTGVSQPYLSQLESGKKPSKKIIFKILWGLCEDEPKEFIGMYGILMDVAGYEVKPEQKEILEKAMIEYSTLSREIDYIEAQIALFQNELKWWERENLDPRIDTAGKNKVIDKLEKLVSESAIRKEKLQTLKIQIDQCSKLDRKLEKELEKTLVEISKIRENYKNNFKIEGFTYKNDLENEFAHKEKHVFNFEIPAYRDTSIEHGTFSSYIPPDEALEYFFNVENLLKLNPTMLNFKGIKLTESDVQNILKKIEEMKEEFTNFNKE
ncbi:helix-turn-helix domain-containing protein [Lysinibacillus agricola]|uniref:helix-turn-helix domain-containing protein n=1 Tax=Lysinibacillus agricola TaxID=2590012 RepID=UPI003C2747F9